MFSSIVNTSGDSSILKTQEWPTQEMSLMEECVSSFEGSNAALQLPGDNCASDKLSMRDTLIALCYKR
jgi:hypothetical protein